MIPADIQAKLLAEARRAQSHAHAPWSHFPVGAAILCSSGRIYGGCNVENSSFPLTCCAERVAVFKAISEGESRIDAVLVLTNMDQPASPCGACRQVLYEFGADAIVLIAGPMGIVRDTTMRHLLPEGFCADDLRRAQAG